MTELVWVTDPRLDLGRVHLGHEPLGELLKAESKLLWSVLRREAHDGFRMPAFTGWNIALARIHVIVRFGQQVDCVSIRQTDETGKELVFLSGRSAADVLAYSRRHARDTVDATKLDELETTHRLIGFGEAVAGAYGSWDAREFSRVRSDAAGLTSARPDRLYHSERGLLHLFRRRRDAIEARALAALHARGSDSGVDLDCEPSPRKRRRVDVGEQNTVGARFEILALVVDVATTRTMCADCQTAASSLLQESTPPVYLRAIAESWFKKSLGPAVRGLQPGGPHRFLHTHHDAIRTREGDDAVLGTAALPRSDVVDLKTHIPRVPGRSTKHGAPGSPRESLIVPPNDYERCHFLALRQLHERGGESAALADGMIGVLNGRAGSRRDDLQDRVRDAELSQPAEDDEHDEDDENDDPTFEIEDDEHDEEGESDDALDSDFADYLEEAKLTDPMRCGLGLVSCEEGPSAPPPAGASQPAGAEPRANPSRKRGRDA